MIIPGFWIQYSKAVAALLTGDANNWMLYSETLFPKVAKCSYDSYGPSGTLQSFDALCLLPLNILNQKLFIIIWIWYIIQMITSIVNVFYWILISICESVRIYILHQKSLKIVSQQLIAHASHNAHLGHFFVLNQIAKNTNPITFAELITDLGLSIARLDRTENV